MDRLGRVKISSEAPNHISKKSVSHFIMERISFHKAAVNTYIQLHMTADHGQTVAL